MKLLKTAFYTNCVTLFFTTVLILMEIGMNRVSAWDMVAMMIVMVNVVISYRMLERKLYD